MTEQVQGLIFVLGEHGFKDESGYLEDREVNEVFGWWLSRLPASLPVGTRLVVSVQTDVQTQGE